MIGLGATLRGIPSAVQQRACCAAMGSACVVNVDSSAFPAASASRPLPPRQPSCRTSSSASAARALLASPSSRPGAPGPRARSRGTRRSHRPRAPGTDRSNRPISGCEAAPAWAHGASRGARRPCSAGRASVLDREAQTDRAHQQFRYPKSDLQTLDSPRGSKPFTGDTSEHGYVEGATASPRSQLYSVSPRPRCTLRIAVL